MICIPDELCVGCKKNEHIHSIQNSTERTNYIVECAIVTLLNKDIDIIKKNLAKHTSRMRMEVILGCIPTSVPMKCYKEKKMELNIHHCTQSNS
jgi:hypothetical protein